MLFRESNLAMAWLLAKEKSRSVIFDETQQMYFIPSFKLNITADPHVIRFDSSHNEFGSTCRN